MSLQSSSYRRLTDAVALSKSVLAPRARRMEFQGFLPLGISQFTHRIAFSPRHTFGMQACRMLISAQYRFRMSLISLSAFVRHILHVVRMRAKKEVCGLNTQGRIARVQHKQSFLGPCTCAQEPTCDMGTDVAVFVRCSTKVAVSLLSMDGALPQPTLVRPCFHDFTPETQGKCLMRTRGSCRMVAVRPTVLPDFGLMRQDLKGLATRLVSTEQGNFLSARLLSRQASASGRTIPDPSTLGFARHGLKGLRTWLVGTEKLNTWDTMSRHQLISLSRRWRHVLGPRVDRHTRLFIGGRPTPPNSSRVYNICSCH